MPVALRYKTMASADTWGFHSQYLHYISYRENSFVLDDVEPDGPYPQQSVTAIRILAMKSYETMCTTCRYHIPLELRWNIVDYLPELKRRVLTRAYNIGQCQVDRQYIRACNVPRDMEDEYVELLISLGMIVAGEANIIYQSLREIHVEKDTRLQNLQLFSNCHRDTTDITIPNYFSQGRKHHSFPVPICTFPFCRFHRGYLATAHLRSTDPYPYLDPNSPFNYCPTLYYHYVDLRQYFVSAIDAQYPLNSPVAKQVHSRLSSRVPPATEIFTELADFVAENKDKGLYNFYPFHYPNVWSREERLHVFEYKDHTVDGYFYVPKMTYNYRTDDLDAVAFTYPYLDNPFYAVKHPKNAYLTATYGRPKRYYRELGEDGWYASWAIEKGVGSREVEGFNKIFTVRGGGWVRPKGSYARRPGLVTTGRIEREVLDEVKVAARELYYWKKKETAEGRGDARGDGWKRAEQGWYPELSGDRARVLTRDEAGEMWIDSDDDDEDDDIMSDSRMSTPEIRRTDESDGDEERDESGSEDEDEDRSVDEDKEMDEV